MVTAEKDVILAFPEPLESIPNTTQFRSTWIVQSLGSLRSSGHFERYLTELREYKEEILSCVAAAWLPIEVARAHYRACDALGLSAEEQAAIAQGSGAQIRKAWHASLISAAEKAGASPWTVLPVLHRAWRRGANGGAAAVYRLGPNMARIEYRGCELFDIPYFRQAVLIVNIALLEHCCDKLEASVLAQSAHGQCAYQMQWAAVK
jgi:hypothetical protein